MSICLTEVRIKCGSQLGKALLSTALSNSDIDDWGVSAQNFRLRPFLALADADPALQDQADTIWCRWLSVDEDKGRCQLNLEWETQDLPPLFALDALIAWLQQQQAPFKLKAEYSRDDDRFHGKLKAAASD